MCFLAFSDICGNRPSDEVLRLPVAAASPRQDLQRMEKQGELRRMIAKLCSILRRVQQIAGDDFSGVGVIVCDTPDTLPILPLRPVSSPSEQKNLIRALAEVSTIGNEYHDGFHIVSSDWRLIRVSQYFSPPIVASAVIDRSKLFGGRYVAALFGSAIGGVHLTGIASRRFGIAVFKDGSERFFEATHD